MEYVLRLQNLMISNNYLIAIRDNFENLLSRSVLKITDEKIKDENLEVHVKNRVFGVIVECVQNICSTNSSDSAAKDSMLLLNRVLKGYQIVAGSRVSQVKKERLENLLTEISTMTPDEIKSTKQQIMTSREKLNELSQERLTFSELYLRSNGHVKFVFEAENSDSYFFMVKIEITNA